MLRSAFARIRIAASTGACAAGLGSWAREVAPAPCRPPWHPLSPLPSQAPVHPASARKRPPPLSVLPTAPFERQIPSILFITWSVVAFPTRAASVQHGRRPRSQPGRRGPGRRALHRRRLRGALRDQPPAGGAAAGGALRVAAKVFLCRCALALPQPPPHAPAPPLRRLARRWPPLAASCSG